MPLKGQAMSKEHKMNISKALKGAKRRPHTEEHKQKLSNKLKGRFTGEAHHAWKGESVGYYALHKWVYRQYGKANECEFVDETCSTHFEWSNKSGDYKRDRSDWQQLCRSHHNRYDGIKVPLGTRWPKNG
jgi:hypothetical protein